MRISDWSSDVCSSDLQPRHLGVGGCSWCLFRGRVCRGRHCSLVERRLVGGMCRWRLLVLLPGFLDLGGVERGCWWWVLLGTLLGPEGSDRLVWLLGGLLFPYTVSCWGWVWGVGWCRLLFEYYTVDASIFVARQATQGTWWMPWHQETMKAVELGSAPGGEREWEEVD